MGEPRIVKRVILGIGLGMLSLIVVFAVMLMSGSSNGVARAAAGTAGFNLPVSQSAFPSVSALRPATGVHVFAARSRTLTVAVRNVSALDLLLTSLQPALVQSFALYAPSYVTTAFVQAEETPVERDSASIAPYILLGSATAWSYAALTGAFGDDGVPGGGDPLPPAGNPPVNDTTTIGGNPPGNNPPGNNPPGNTPPGNNPPGNNPPGNNPPGNNPPGNNPPGNTPPGNTPPGNTPPGNTPPGSTPPGNTPTGNNPPGNTPPGNDPPGNDPPTGTPTGTPVDPTPTDPRIPPVPLDTATNPQTNATVTPEPVTTVLLGSGLAALAAYRRRRKRRD